MRKFLKQGLRYYIYLMSLGIILVAVVLQTCRVLAPQVDAIRPDLEQFLTEQSGVDIRLGKMDANWYGLRPHLLIDSISFRSEQGSDLLKVEKAYLSLDLLQSFLQWQWVWRHIAFERIDVDISQNSQGGWLIAGFPVGADSASGWSYRNPIELFKLIPQVDIAQANIQLSLSNGQSIPIVIPAIQIENDNTFHRLQASAEFQGRDVFTLVMEKDSQVSEQALAYVNFDKFPLQNFLPEKTIAALLPDSTIHSENATIDMSLWFDLYDEQVFGVVGKLASLHMPPLKFEQLELPAARLSTNIRGHFSQVQGWQIGFRDFQIADDYRINQVVISKPLSDPLELMADRIMLSPLTTMLSTALTNKKAQQVLAGLSVTGGIDHFNVTLPEMKLKNARVSGRLMSVTTQPHDKIPGFTNANGYFESGVEGGFVNLNTEQSGLFAKAIYSQSLPIARVKGQVAWRLEKEKNRILINSSRLQVDDVYGQAKGYFLLDVPWESGSRPSKFHLAIGLRDSHSKYYPQFLPDILPESLEKWLAASIKNGDVPEAGLIYRGEFSDRKKRTVQLFINVENGRLEYSQEWPELIDASAQVVVDNRLLKGHVTRAIVLDEPLEQLSVQWPYGKNETLRVVTSATIAAKTGLRLLNESWLKTKVGDTFDQWEVGGQVAVNADIEVDLQKSGGEGEDRQQVAVDFLENVFHLKKQNLPFSDVTGKLLFTQDQGLYAKNIKATLFGEPFIATIEQDERKKSISADDVITVKGKGDVSPNTLSTWFEHTAPLVMQGSIPYAIDLVIPVDRKKPVKVDVASNLSGVSIDLPEPLGKKASVPSALSINAVLFNNDVQSYTIDYQNTLKAVLSTTPKGMSGVMTINEPNRPVKFPPENQFSLYASLKTLDVLKWLDVFESYRGDQSNNRLSRVDYHINTQQLQLDSYQLQDFSVKGYKSNTNWFSTLQSDSLKGRVIVDETFSSPIKVNLDYVKIIDNDEAKQSNSSESLVDPLADFDLSRVREADVVVNALTYKDKQFDQLSFSMRPVDQGVVIDRMKVAFSGMTLVGLDEKTDARLLWVKPGNSKGYSQFTGQFVGGDIQQLFDEWGLPASLQSEETQFQLNVGWEGSPAAFSVNTLYGDVKANLEEGVFLRNRSQASTGILRLFSLFNFDTWARRLRLDFSDLYKKGIVFDSLSTRLNFDKGNIYFQEPLHVESTSSEFTMAGVIDYPNESIDAVLVTTLPIGGNLTFAAALAAGLPAAVGVYIVGKLFKPQVDKVSSLTYSVKGNWAKPKVKFMRIFDNSFEKKPEGVEEVPLDEAFEEG